MTDSVFKIHPAIGFARVGTSKEFNLAPETLTGHPVAGSEVTGGLPIVPGTESETIKASDLRDAGGALKRQAARFRIYNYAAQSAETYPMGDAGEEIVLGSRVVVGGVTKTVADIVWTVHMANKKTAWYQSPDDEGIVAWMDGKTPPQRNIDLQPPVQPPLSNNPHDEDRLARLTIDAGPRTIHGTSSESVAMNAKTPASIFRCGAGGITELPDYPKSFPQCPPKPAKGFETLNPPGVEPITTLGDLSTEENGRLVVAGGHGLANSFNVEGPQYGFIDSVNNDWWFDDTGDGPVNASLVFDDGSCLEVQGHAWVVATDPAYAPQILNVVSLWDEVYDSFVRKLELRPELFTGKKFVPTYTPSFEDEVKPIFLSAGLQRWITNLNQIGIGAHDKVAAIAAGKDPADTQLHGLGLIREPVDPEKLGVGPPVSGDDRRMPLSLGDSARSLLSLSKTQYYYLERWDVKGATGKPLALNAGETLDKASFYAGLGGRFSPGIDLTFICREPDLYVQSWQTSGTGPFRINPQPLDYQSGGPCLSLGWMPRREKEKLGVEPGDLCKFMAIPWHADYNSCAVHLPAPNPEFNNTLYWSWPAQRPVAVHKAADVSSDGQTLGEQRFSVRGEGTKTSSPNPPQVGPQDAAEVGRYQQQPPTGKGAGPGIMRILDHWMNIGTVIQATNIDDGVPYDPTFFLEVMSRLEDKDSDGVMPWPTNVPAGSGSGS